MRIDIHPHFLCLDFVKHLQGRSDLPTTVRDGGGYVVQCVTGMNVPVIPKIIDMEQKLREADEMGTDVSVLTHALPPDMVGAPQPTSGPCASTTT